MSTKAVEVADPGPDAATVTVEVRGKRYSFRELEISEYDKVVKQASHQEADEDGIMQDVTDNTLLLRLLVIKSAVEPKLTAETVNALGTRLYRALARVVNDLHFDIEPITQIKDETPATEAPKEEVA
jgi:hypothetical protein